MSGMSLPQRLGRLRQISRLGSGGFATVWLYDDPDLDSSVAVKALADNWAAHTDVRERFLEEAKMLRRADSDHVVRVYDIGVTDDDTPYFVMTYADQGTVADLLAGDPLEVDEVVRIVTEAGQGLSRLHEIGILHRDVKPQNLLLRTDHGGVRRVIVADLGVAKASVNASGITQVVGTPAYMAPEQADPTAGVDERADVHALGAVAYHLLTGRQVRHGTVQALLTASEPEPPSEVAASVPTALDPVILKAIRHHREDRWSTVAAFTSSLALAASTRTVAGMPAAAVPARTEPVGTRRPRRRRLVGAAVVLALVAAVVAGVVAVMAPTSGGGAKQASSAVAEPVAPTMQLGSGWQRDAASSSDTRTTYERDDADVHLRLDTEVMTSPPSVTGPVQLGRVSASKDFQKVLSRRLGTAERGPWQDAWEVRYHFTGVDGNQHEVWQWYLGNARQTAGFVSIYADRGDTENYRSRLLRARRAAFP